MSKFIRNNALKLLFLSFLLFGIAYVVDARPGGGHSSRRSSGGGGRSSGGGGSRSSGGSSFGGGGGGGGEITALEAAFIFGFLGICLIIVVVDKVQKMSSGDYQEDYTPITSKGTFTELEQIQNRKHKAQKQLDKLIKSQDPNFSETLFLDFVQNIFYQYYNRHGRDSFQGIKPFVAGAKLPINLGGTYSQVVINAIHIVGAYQGDEQQQIEVLIESNYTVNETSRFFAQSIWTFARNNGLASLEPQKMQSIACPSCGAPDSFEDGLKCRNCGTLVEPSSQQWALKYARTSYEESYNSSSIVSYEEEQGTDLATVYGDNLAENKKQFAALHNLESFDNYFKQFQNEIVKPTFSTIYTAWSNKRWDKARHLMSDFLHTSLSFWLEEYNKNGFSNKLENIEVKNIQLADVQVDKYYETFTVRIYASCIDYTVRDNVDKVIGGNKEKPRAFSEYWTFIRHADKHQHSDKLSPYDHLDNCPACGAPADKVSNSGSCGYCGNKLSTGEFSWILSRITQDEAYV